VRTESRGRTRQEQIHEFAIRQEAFHDQFAADVPAAQVTLMGATQRPVTEAVLSEGLPTDAPAWKLIPSWFVFGDQDLNIALIPAERAGSRGTRELTGTSHALSVSNPDAVGATILDSADAASP
jgi:pimeloyl-ACP methyl ester carboxylesterase